MSGLAKRSKEQRELDMNRLADLYVRQTSQMDIARVLGISQGQVSNDLKKLLKRWEEQRLDNIDMYKNAELHRINKMEEDLWVCWENSKTKTKTIITKSKSGEVGQIFNPATAKKEAQQKEKYWKAGSTEEIPVGGNMEYMNGIMWCVQERMKILGGYAPKKVANTDPSGTQEAGVSAKEELMLMLGSIVEKMKPETQEELDYVEGEIVDKLLEGNDVAITDADVPELARRLQQENLKRLPPKPEDTARIRSNFD